MKTLIGVMTALALPASAAAQQAKQCVPAAQAEALVTFALPSLVRGAVKHCGKTLPATSPLIQSGPTIASRYQAEAQAAWPDAKVAADKLAGMEVSKFLGEDGAVAMLDAALEEGMTKDLKPQDRAWMDKVITGLAPLPARNISSIVVGILQATSKPGKKEPLSICPAS